MKRNITKGCSTATYFLHYVCFLAVFSAIAAIVLYNDGVTAGYYPHTSNLGAFAMLLDPQHNSAKSAIEMADDIRLVPGTVNINADLASVIRDALFSGRTRKLIPASRYYAVTNIRKELDWQFVSVDGFLTVGPNLEWQVDNANWLGLVLVHRESSGKLNGAVEWTDEYSHLLERVPEQIMSSTVKRGLDPRQREPFSPNDLILSRFPYQVGPSILYGSYGVHNADYCAMWPVCGWVAVDLVSDGGSGHAPNAIYAAQAASIVGNVCNDGTSVAVFTGNLLYAHFLNNSNLQTGHYFNLNDYMGQLKSGTFSGTCGHADGQAANAYHIHWGFPDAPIQAGQWRLDPGNPPVQNSPWTRSGYSPVYRNNWIPDTGGGPTPTPSNNQPPRVPGLISPNNWAEVESNAPTLRWQNNGDPNGDPVQFYVDVTGEHTANSGWISDPSSWRPSSLDGQYATYHWRVKARDVGVNRGAESSWTETWNFTIRASVPTNTPVPAPPYPPQLQSPEDNAVFNEGESFPLSWGSVPFATQYQAEYTGGPTPIVPLPWQSDRSWNIGSPPAGYVYEWRAEARNNTGYTEWSSRRRFTVRLTAPTNLVAQEVSCNQVHLTWNNNSNYEEGYKIYRNGSYLDQVGTDVTSYDSTGLSENTSYSFYVVAFRGANDSNSSNTVNIGTPACSVPTDTPVPIPPYPPQLQSPPNYAVFNEGETIPLSWGSVTYATQYQAEYTGGPTPVVPFYWQSNTFWNIDSPPPPVGYIYQWRAEARNDVGYTEWSEPYTFTVRPAMPTNLVAQAISCNQVSLTWTDNSNSEEGYRIFREGDGEIVGEVGPNVESYIDTLPSGGSGYSYYVYAFTNGIGSNLSDTAYVELPPCATPTNTPVPCAVVQGSITNNDPIQAGRLFRDGWTTACGDGKQCPGLYNTTPVHYDAYTFVNNASSARCVTVNLDAGTCVSPNNTVIFSEAYLGSYDPSNLCQNYLGDLGIILDSPNASYSFDVPAGASFVVVVNEVNPSAGCPDYSLSVAGLPEPCVMPVNTPTSTPSSTVTPTCGPGSDYVFESFSGASIIPGTNLVAGSQEDDAVVNIPLPFTYDLYGIPFNSVNVSTNGNLQFNSAFGYYPDCLPTSNLNYSIMPYWYDLDMRPSITTTFTPGIYTLDAGNVFYIEWRACPWNVNTCDGRVNFEVKLWQNQNSFDFYYGNMLSSSVGATIGVQRASGVSYTQYSCASTPNPPISGLQIHFHPQLCPTTPTITRTNTPIPPTPTYTAAPCNLSNYQTTTGNATIVSGTTDIGNHTDDGQTIIALPFPVRLYDQTFSNVSLDSNGKAHFGTGATEYTNACLPDSRYTYTIYAYWDDLNTTNSGYGIFTSTSGAAPNRIFNIEWRTQYYPASGSANFELRLYEGQNRFDIIYGTITNSNTSATGGVQKDGSFYTQYFCNSSGGASNGSITYTFPNCVTPTNVPSDTPTFTYTPSWTRTWTPTSTWTPTQTLTNSPANTLSPTNSPTLTPTRTWTLTITPIVTSSPTRTNSPTITRTPTVTRTYTKTRTPTKTLTPTITYTPTRTPRVSRTPTRTFTSVIQFTPTNTATNSATYTTTPSDTATDTPTNTPTFTTIPSTSTSTYIPTSVTNPTSTNTPLLTTTSTRTSTFTSVIIRTNTPTITFTPTTTSRATNTSTNAPTNTPIYTPSSTPGLLTNTRTITRTFTRTPTSSGTRTNTPTNTRTSTPTLVGTPCPGNVTIQGAIGSTDPNQTGRLVHDFVPSTCGVSKSCPGLRDTFTRHYDAYTFVNNTNSSQCITINLTTSCNGTTDIFSATYLGSFDPSNLCANYLGDAGFGPGEGNGTSTYSGNVPVGAIFVVTVHEVTHNAGCGGYTLNIQGCQLSTPAKINLTPKSRHRLSINEYYL